MISRSLWSRPRYQPDAVATVFADAPGSLGTVRDLSDAQLARRAAARQAGSAGPSFAA